MRRQPNSQVRARAAASSRRSTQRRTAPRKPKRPKRRFWSRLRPRRPRKRTWFAATVAVLLGLGAGYLLTQTEQVEETLLELTLPLRHDDIIRQQANDKGVEAPLIAAIIQVESKFQDQTSSAGARGLMQITPQTAEEIEKLSGGSTFSYEDLADPDLNIRYGTFYVRHLIDQFDGNETAAIAAYNAGPSHVHEWGGTDLEEGDIEFQETRDYVDKVLDKRDDYRDSYPEELAP